MTLEHISKLLNLAQVKQASREIELFIDIWIIV